MKNNFEKYFNTKLKEIEQCAIRDKMSITQFLKKNYRMTKKQYKEMILSIYTKKDCHSFWHRECVNKYIKCDECNQFYSIEEYDKMSTKQKNQIKNS